MNMTMIFSRVLPATYKKRMNDVDMYQMRDIYFHLMHQNFAQIHACVNILVSELNLSFSAACGPASTEEKGRTHYVGQTQM